MDESLPVEKLDKTTRHLIRLAMKSRKRAYAPYSKYRVGCAIQSAKGKVHLGCNVENASYSLAICAERVALGKMVSRGERLFKRLVVVTSSDDPVFPCGACLQCIAEFGAEAAIVAVNSRGTLFKQAQLKELFPHFFSKKQLSS